MHASILEEPLLIPCRLTPHFFWHQRDTQRHLQADGASDKADYAEPDVDNDVNSDTDLVNIETCGDDDNEEGNDLDDKTGLFANEDHLPKHYLQQLDKFDEKKYTKEEFKDSTTRLLNLLED